MASSRLETQSGPHLSVLKPRLPPFHPFPVESVGTLFLCCSSAPVCEGEGGGGAKAGLMSPQNNTHPRKDAHRAAEATISEAVWVNVNHHVCVSQTKIYQFLLCSAPRVKTVPGLWFRLIEVRDRWIAVMTAAHPSATSNPCLHGESE